jgi:hypothetical protein
LCLIGSDKAIRQASDDPIDVAPFIYDVVGFATRDGGYGCAVFRDKNRPESLQLERRSPPCLPDYIRLQS